MLPSTTTISNKTSAFAINLAENSFHNFISIESLEKNLDKITKCLCTLYACLF